MITLWRKGCLIVLGGGLRSSYSIRTLSNLLEEEDERLSTFIPESEPLSEECADKLQQFINKSSRIFVLTGAGISTESGIPDYRSKGVGLYDRVNHRPMQHAEFISNKSGRQKYWARNYMGWQKFREHRPNVNHFLLADWEKQEKVYWTVTQNVDALHTAAGSQNLTELHGCLNRVLCLDCGEVSSRYELQTQLDELNKHWSVKSFGMGPDADMFLQDEDVRTFNIADCRSCGGRLKPDVVFFGDSVGRIKVERSFSILSSCDSMLVLGSSLFVWSGYRFIVRALELGIPTACVNIGPTRADDKLDLKINAKCSDILRRMAVS
ncbi:NAD-dependent protein lipoamidase sirtuin-4, mitochondrial-like [Styela clava]